MVSLILFDFKQIYLKFRLTQHLNQMTIIKEK